MDEADIESMKKAISVAAKSNPKEEGVHPKVGAVVVRDGKELAAAYRGEIEPGDHAEYTVMEKKLKRETLAGATVYTTLEPCTTRNHPAVPCAERLIERKVARVFIGMLDPNQNICGRGLRRLREANIEIELFPGELMAVVEEQNREFIREQQRISAATSDQDSKEPAESLVGANELVQAAGLTAFFPSRDYYHTHRGNAPSIDRYIATAQKTLILISVNLMTGLPFDGLCSVLEEKLKVKQSPFSAVLSLLDPRQDELMAAIAPVFDIPPQELADGIKKTIRNLVQFRRTLSSTAQTKMELRIHKAIPFGSAILIDHREPSGRIQIETKPYKAPLRKSFAFEVAPTGSSGLYEALAMGFETLLGEGEIIGHDGLGLA